MPTTLPVGRAWFGFPVFSASGVEMGLGGGVGGGVEVGAWLEVETGIIEEFEVELKGVEVLESVVLLEGCEGFDWRDSDVDFGIRSLCKVWGGGLSTIALDKLEVNGS